MEENEIGVALALAKFLFFATCCRQKRNLAQLLAQIIFSFRLRSPNTLNLEPIEP
jgi:hypothetical protein